MVRSRLQDAQVRKLKEWIQSGRAQQLRIAAGHTLAVAADICDVEPSTVLHWERGDMSPRGRNQGAYYRYLADREVLVGHTLDAKVTESAAVA